VNPRRSRQGALSGSPALIGAVTVLVTMVAVYLSYNANEGLPFVPTYSLTAEVPNSAGLVRGNEVRVGGARVGVVSSIDAESHDDGSVTATLQLELEETMRPLPVDSTLLIRPRSALGLKYVEITKGRSERGYPEDATIPVERAETRPVEIDDFFNMFTDETRVGARGNLDGYGAAFAGRGEALNRTFAQLDSLVREVEPAFRAIGSRRARFERLFPALEQAAAEVAPVAEAQGTLFVGLDTTFTAWASVSEPLQAAISGGPPALDTAIRELPVQRPFLRESEELFRRFRPAFESLAAAAPDLSAAFRSGEPALERSPALNRRLTRTIETLEDLGADPRVPDGLERLESTVATLRPLFEFVEPAQTRCNYFALLFRNGASAISESDVVGSMLRVSPLALPITPGSEAGPAATPANGPIPEGLSVRERSLHVDPFLHSNPYPNTAAPGQTRECEAGNEDYAGLSLRDRQAIGNLPGGQGLFTEKTRRGR
jgi:phospholipid/cholesterol/gamma-HCH transport system substrate-binding protein